MTTHLLTSVTSDKNSVETFVEQFSALTGNYSHGYELAVHKLMSDLYEYRQHGVISPKEFTIIIGTAMDVMDYFNLDLDSLAACDKWYRASVIHQMGQGMLQAIRTTHEELTLDTEYQDALSNLDIGSRASAFFGKEKASQSPISCHNWTDSKARKSTYLDLVSHYGATKKLTVGF